MAVYGPASNGIPVKYTTSTTLNVSGYGMTWAGSPLEKEVVLATANTAVPTGVSLQSCKQNDNIGVSAPGMVVKAVANAAVTVGAKVTVTTGGLFTPCDKGGSGNTFVWGIAQSAAGAQNDVFTMLYMPYQESIT